VRRAISTGAFVLALACLAACGGSASPMSDGAAVALHARFTAVRAAVDTRDADGAARALDDLRQEVARLRRDDDLSDTRAADILGAANDVEDQLTTITTTTTTTTTTTAPTRTAPTRTAPTRAAPTTTAPARTTPTTTSTTTTTTTAAPVTSPPPKAPDTKPAKGEGKKEQGGKGKG
jgi:cell division septation protein DedD